MDQDRIKFEQRGQEEYKNKSRNLSAQQSRHQDKDKNEGPKIKQKKQISPLDVKNSWPIFKPIQKTFNDNKFWNKSKQNIEKTSNHIIIFQGTLIKMNQNKKKSKTHYYKLTSEGILLNFRREDDENAKGYVQISTHIFVHLTQQSTNKMNNVLVIRIEKFDGISLTVFQSSNEIILDFFDNLKVFAITTGFNRLYQQMGILGKGSFASVFKVRSLIKKEQFFAAKVYFKETFESNQNQDKFVIMIKNEIQALRQCKHEGIICLYEVIQDTDILVLIIELVEGGDLYQLIRQVKQITEEQGVQLLKNICEALDEMHNKGYVHRDLKLENIMICKKDLWDIKLVDFGFTEPINETQLISKAGTPGYIAPEIFRFQPYTPKGDVFSLGIIFFALFSGFSPFKGKNYSQVLFENRRCNIHFDHTVWAEYSTHCKAILKKMLARNPQNRITIKDILQSDWIIYSNLGGKIARLNQNNNPVILQKQLTKHSQFNQFEDYEEKYSLDFSYQNNLKSFYMRLNSQKHFKSFKNIGINQNQEIIKRQKSVKVIKSSEQQNEQQNEELDQFIKSRAKEKRGSIEEIFEDQSISVKNINFLMRAQKIFNQKKLP